MTAQLIIVDNPFDPRSWEEIETEDVLAAIALRFPQWPATAQVFDLEGMDWTRVAATVDPSILAGRNVTPRGTKAQVDRGVKRLGQLRGPIMITIGPADPLTAILVIIAVVVGVAAALLFQPKVPTLENRNAGSPNNELSKRTNQARPNGRIPDIFGTVIHAAPDLIAVPYSIFENNLEKEISYMCLGRGAYDVAQISDGDTLIAEIAGAGVEVYGPFTSPNHGAPQLRIGTAIAEEVLSVVKMTEVNGQTLRPPNYNNVRGNNSIRFVAPDTIETNDTNIDFTNYFGPLDVVAVSGADFGNAAVYDATVQSARFYPDKRIEFESFDPSTLFHAGQTLVITNGGFAGPDTDGNILYIDVSGTEVIDTVNSTTIQLV